jgi:asparagine synthase (glutamine-hydrolysing)
MSGINAKEFKNLTGKNISKYYSKYYSKTRFSNFLDQSQNTDLNRYLPDNCLTKVDRSALAHGLEARPPFLDHEFVEFANKLSPKLRLNGNISKYILKKSFEGILPNKIIYRKKQGFGVPLKYYFKKELKPYVKKYLINYDKHNLFNTEYIKNNLDYYIKNNPRLIWRIIIFNLWWEKWQ